MALVTGQPSQRGRHDLSFAAGKTHSLADRACRTTADAYFVPASVSATVQLGAFEALRRQCWLSLSELHVDTGT